MQAKSLIRTLWYASGILLSGAILTACGQKGPLTLPQQPPPVADQTAENLSSVAVKQSGEVSGTL